LHLKNNQTDHPPIIDLGGDHHIHTRFCNHASGTMEDYVQSALSNGLKSMTFLEHLECNILYDHRTWLTRELFQEYFREGRKLQQRYFGRISIRLGVEVGYNPMSVSELQEELSRFPFEHVGMSYHFYFAGNSHLNMVSSRRDNLDALAEKGPDSILDEYFNGLIRACNVLPCDKVCHLDAVLRHMPRLCLQEKHEKKIEQLSSSCGQRKLRLK